MRYRQFASAEEGPRAAPREAQIMIGHPNNSGLQMDQVTQLYIPAFFVNELTLSQDDSPVLSMEGGISISEDPNLRFTYVSNGAKRFRAEAKDTDGHVFRMNGMWRSRDVRPSIVIAAASEEGRFARDFGIRGLRALTLRTCDARDPARHDDTGDGASALRNTSPRLPPGRGGDH